jgi:hypothetical protein
MSATGPSNAIKAAAPIAIETFTHRSVTRKGSARINPEKSTHKSTLQMTPT